MVVANTDNRHFFPFFDNKARMVYFDNAATTQKPVVVIETLCDYYTRCNANIQRGSYTLSREAEEEVLGIRKMVEKWINASSEQEIIFTSGATEALNMVCTGYGAKYVGQGDEVIVSVLEHHSNFLPWERLCRERKAHLRVVPLTPKGVIDIEVLARMVNARTKVLAINYVSHVLGSVNPIAQISKLVHKVGGIVVVDGAQALAHQKVDVEALDCDFLAFSGHKMYGPMGIGVLYGKAHLLEKMAPLKVGGGMVKGFSSDYVPAYERVPYRFEAGTLNVGGIMGLGAALGFLGGVGYQAIKAHEDALMRYFREKMDSLGNITWLLDQRGEVGIATFNVKGVHALDVGLRLDAAGIAVRTGSFCASPLMDYLGVKGGVRVSFAMYNTVKEIDRFVEVVKRYFITSSYK